jgi:hypothetical protein
MKSEAEAYSTFISAQLLQVFSYAHTPIAIVIIIVRVLTSSRWVVGRTLDLHSCSLTIRGKRPIRLTRLRPYPQHLQAVTST